MTQSPPAASDGQPGPAEPHARPYRAFISYSSAADGMLCPALQRGLHRLAKPWYRPPAFRVFRDATSLAASAGLWASIERALSSSDFFLLMASPLSRSSPWVIREVDWWLDNRPLDRLLVVLTDGDLRWDGASAGFVAVPEAVDPLPPRLRHALRTEPRWVDLRWARDAGDLSLRHPRFRDAVADLAAPLHGVAKEQLVGEDLRQQRRTARWRNSAVAALLGLTIVAAVASVQFWNQRNIARQQRDLAVARQLAAQSSVQADRQPELSLLLAVAGAQRAPSIGRPAALDHLATMLDRGYHTASTLRGHTAAVKEAAFVPDQKSLISAADDGTLRVWKTSGTQPATAVVRTGSDAATSIVISPDGRYVAAGSGKLQVWNAQGGRPTDLRWTADGATYAVAFNSDGRTVASSDGEGRIRLWDVTRGTLRRPPLDHGEGVVWDVTFSPDGRWLASAGEDMRIQLWDVRTGTRQGTAMTRLRRGIFDLAFSPDGKLLASTANDGRVTLWSTARRTVVRDVRLPGSATAVAFSHDGRVLATGDGDGAIRLWDPATGDPVGEPIHGHLGGIWSLAFSADDRRLASASGDNTVRLWDVAETRPLAMPLSGLRASVDVTYTRDGRLLAAGGSEAGSDDAVVKIWEAATGHLRRTLRIRDGELAWSVAFAPDGRRLAAGDAKGNIELWDIGPGQPVRRIRAHSEQVNGLAFNPDGRLLASAGDDNQVKIWDVGSGNAVGAPLVLGDAATDVAFDPDGSTVAASGADGTVLLRDTAGSRPAHKLASDHEAGVYAIAFNGIRSALVTASADGTLRTWDPATGASRGGPVRGHVGEVWSVDVSPDGRTLVSGGADGTVRLWDASSGRPRAAPFGGQAFWVYDVAFHPNGRQVASARIDGMIQFWDLDTQSWLRKACAIAGRDISREEWAAVVGTEVPYRQVCP